MAFDRTDTFTLSKNERRDKPSHPEYTGTLNINGVEYWLSAWVKEGSGRKFFSGQVRLKDAPRKTQAADDFSDGSVPF